MTSQYRHADWLRYRREVLLIDAHQCVRCRRSAADGATLQVHHKRYISGRKPWEYPLTDCETLCKGCHAEEHGHITPKSGWTLIASDDLGDLVGECEHCGTALRYIFAVTHPLWGSLAVGTDCCDKLTATTEASEFMLAFEKRRDKLARFIESTRWKVCSDGATSLSQKGSIFRIEPHDNRFRITVNGDVGKRTFETLIDARKHLFDAIETGRIAKFVARQREEREKARAEARHFAYGYGAFAP